MSNKSDYSHGSLLDISHLKYPNLLLLESSTQKICVLGNSGLRMHAGRSSVCVINRYRIMNVGDACEQTLEVYHECSLSFKTIH